MFGDVEWGKNVLRNDEEQRTQYVRSPKQKFIGVLFSSTTTSKAATRIADETPMLQPLPIDSDASETVIPRDCAPMHHAQESAGSSYGMCKTSDGSTIENERKKTSAMPPKEGTQ